MKLTKMECNGVDYCTELLCDYVTKNSGKICDKALVKLTENLCNSYNYENELKVFGNYFFNMGVIVLIFGLLTLKTQREYKLQSSYDKIDGIFDELERLVKQGICIHRTDKSTIKEKFFNKYRKSGNNSIFKEAWKCEFNNVLKELPYWSNIFKLKRTEHQPELCKTDWKGVYDNILKEIRYEIDWKSVYDAILKDVQRESSSLKYRRFCRLSKKQTNSFEKRLNYKHVVGELKQKIFQDNYKSFVKNFKEFETKKRKKSDSDFVKVEKPGWGWFGFN